MPHSKRGHHSQICGLGFLALTMASQKERFHILSFGFTLDAITKRVTRNKVTNAQIPAKRVTLASQTTKMGQCLKASIICVWSIWLIIPSIGLHAANVSQWCLTDDFPCSKKGDISITNYQQNWPVPEDQYYLCLVYMINYLFDRFKYRESITLVPT